MLTTFCQWSGGKDAAMALWLAQQQGITVSKLITTTNAETGRVAMHGVNHQLLQQQANALGIPLQTLPLAPQIGMAAYEEAMHNLLTQLSSAGYGQVILGDIFLEDLKAYREAQLQPHGIKAQFPLWQQSTADLAKSIIAAGIKATIVCVNSAYLDASFLGRVFDEQFLNDLPEGVDPCGENGEFHSFVWHAPHFKEIISFQLGDTVSSTYPAPQQKEDACYHQTPAQPVVFYFQDLIPTT